jgi:prepilin-type N-terminal cleavage/methylation domain-containing protein
MYINKSRQSGFTLVEIMIVVAIIGLLAAIAIPNFVKARTASQKSACIANMRQIEGAKWTWALEAKKSDNVTVNVTDIIGSTSYIKSEPFCPAVAAGTSYSYGTVGTQVTCPSGIADHVLP